MSLALYRTYRPGDFTQVIGQEHVTAPLTRALDNDRIHHAYLFTGPRGCGKTSSARIMARSMNCEKGPTSTPCGVCQSCIDLAPNGPGSIDVIEIDAATYRGIDDAKELRERAVYAPVHSRYKVYIIDEAHQLTRDAFNVLLKLVEEPPPHLRFIFATTEPDKIIPTLRSRTHHYPFRLVSARGLQEHLAWVCEQEKISAEPAALALIARAGTGSVRDAMSVLGQIQAGAGPEGITYNETVAQLGFTDDVMLTRFVTAIAAGDGASLFTLIDEVVNSGHEPRRFVTDLLERLRDLLVITQVPDSASSGLFDIPSEQLTDLVEQAKLFTPSQLVRVANLVSSGLSELRGAASPRLMMELLAARLVTTEVAEDLSERVAKLEQGGVVASVRPSVVRAAAEAAASAPAPTSAPVDVPVAKPAVDKADGPSTVRSSPPARPATTPTRSAPPLKPSQVTGAKKPEPVVEAPIEDGGSVAPVAGAKITIDQVKRNWAGILERVKENKRAAWMNLQDAQPVSLADDNILAIAFPIQANANAFKSNGYDDWLRMAITDVMHIDVRFDAMVDGSKSARTTPSKKPAEVDLGDASPDDEVLQTKSAIDLVKAMGAKVISETTNES